MFASNQTCIDTMQVVATPYHIHVYQPQRGVVLEIMIRIVQVIAGVKDVEMFVDEFRF